MGTGTDLRKLVKTMKLRKENDWNLFKRMETWKKKWMGKYLMGRIENNLKNQDYVIQQTICTKQYSNLQNNLLSNCLEVAL